MIARNYRRFPEALELQLTLPLWISEVVAGIRQAFSGAPANDQLCECGAPKSKHNAFFFKCSTFRPFKVDMSAESAAALAGANSAATKRARGQELMPTLHLRGSTPKKRMRVKEPA